MAAKNKWLDVALQQTGPFGDSVHFGSGSAPSQESIMPLPKKMAASSDLILFINLSSSKPAQRAETAAGSAQPPRHK